jgi:murein DD-endopeptidase MepM/ murein hydrolase activator NlpD
MYLMRKIRLAIVVEVFCLLICCAFIWKENRTKEAMIMATEGEFIKWVDFNASYEALQVAYEWDLNTYGKENHVNWVELLSYVAAKNGGEFKSKVKNEISETAQQIADGKTTITELKKGLKYYDYYMEAYGAILNGLVGEYEQETKAGSKKFEKKYGLKGFLPVAKGFPYSDYDDFGVSRSYGYKREHLGHDMMGQIGTPIINVESGIVEALGWNQYGGWRLGIRSFDKKRYYYYAHLRQNYPFAEGLKEGSIVTAGDVIGYMGHTGYSATENVNNIEQVHLHFGLQLIFDESQKEGNAEIWINPYNLIRFLKQNQSEVLKVGDTKDWERVIDLNDPAVEDYKK